MQIFALKLPRGFCGVSFRHLIRRQSNYSPVLPTDPLTRYIPNRRLFRRLLRETARHFPKGTYAALGATFVKVGRGWAGWHFAARNCAWHRGRNSFLPSLAQPCELPGQHPLLTSPGTYLSLSRTGLISYGCLVERFVSPRSRDGKRNERRGESKLEWWGSAGYRERVLSIEIDSKGFRYAYQPNSVCLTTSRPLTSWTRGAHHPITEVNPGRWSGKGPTALPVKGLRGRTRPHRLGFNRSHYHFELPTPRISSDLPRFDHRWMEKMDIRPQRETERDEES